MNRRLHAWAFARLQGRIEDKATEAGIPVRFVNPRYTSQTCHECGHIGRRGSQAEFKCTNDNCHVTEFHADINAAANIAARVDPWGESVPWKPERNDFLEDSVFQWSENRRFSSTPRNGSASDSATVHCETSEKSSQMTLAAYSD